MDEQHRPDPDHTPEQETARPEPRPETRSEPQPQHQNRPQPPPQAYPGPGPAAVPPPGHGPQPGWGYPPAAASMPPAAVAAPPRPAPFKRGFGLGAGAGLGFGGAMLVIGLIGSLLSGIMLMGFAGAASSLAGAGQTAVEPLNTVWGNPDGKHTLRAIPVTGAIQTSGGDGFALTAGTYGYEVAEVLDKMTESDADGVVLLLNTPGGSVTGSRAMSDAVDRYRERTGKKVYAFVQGMSASGGMYTMAGADEIIADHGSVVGSVGVIMGPIERYRDVTQAGSILGSVTAGEITNEYVTAGTGKDAGQPYRDLTDQERANLQGIVDAMYDDFVGHVASKRGIDRAKIVNELGAFLFTGQAAIDAGYVDAIMGRDEAMRHFAEASGLDPAETRLVESAPPALWASLFGVQKRAWGVAPAAVPVAGQPARATARMCTDPTTPIAWHGPLVGVCG